MEIKGRFPIRLPDDLYDRVVQHTGSHDKAQDFVDDAVRFWLSVAESSSSPMPALSPQQEALARRVVNFLQNTSSKQRQGILMLMEDWYDRQSRSRE
jgi:hypothetical protein